MTTIQPRTEQATPAKRLLLLTRLYAAADAPLTEVRLTPALYGGGTLWCAMALGTDRREIPLPKGAAKTLSRILRKAFPSACWDRAQDYDVATGTLVEHVTVLPAALTGGAR